MSSIKNPFTLVDPQIAHEARRKCTGDPTKISNMIASANRLLDGVAAEGYAGDAFDLGAVTCVSGGAADKMDAIVKAHSELAGAIDARNQLKAMSHSEQWRDARMSNDDTPIQEAHFNESGPRDFADAFTAKGIRKFTAGVKYEIDLPSATLFKTSDGWTPEFQRTGRVRLARQWRPTMPDLFGAPIPWPQSKVAYMVETITTDATAVKAEGAASAESDLSYAETTQDFPTIRAIIPVTEEQMQDVPSIQSFLSRRLMYLAERNTDASIYTEVSKATGRQTQTAEKTGSSDWNPKDPIFDLHKLIEKVHTTGEAPPTGMAMHPALWNSMARVRTTTQEYLSEGPFRMTQQTLWGLPVVEAISAQAPGAGAKAKVLAVVGDFATAADIYYRKAATVDVGLNADDFSKYQISLRVSMRATAVVYRPASFGLYSSAA